MVVKINLQKDRKEISNYGKVETQATHGKVIVVPIKPGGQRKIIFGSIILNILLIVCLSATLCVLFIIKNNQKCECRHGNEFNQENKSSRSKNKEFSNNKSKDIIIYMDSSNGIEDDKLSNEKHSSSYSYNEGNSIDPNIEAEEKGKSMDSKGFPNSKKDQENMSEHSSIVDHDEMSNSNTNVQESHESKISNKNYMSKEDKDTPIKNPEILSNSNDDNDDLITSNDAIIIDNENESIGSTMNSKNSEDVPHGNVDNNSEGNSIEDSVNNVDYISLKNNIQGSNEDKRSQSNKKSMSEEDKDTPKDSEVLSSNNDDDGVIILNDASLIDNENESIGSTMNSKNSEDVPHGKADNNSKGSHEDRRSHVNNRKGSNDDLDNGLSKYKPEHIRMIPLTKSEDYSENSRSSSSTTGDEGSINTREKRDVKNSYDKEQIESTDDDNELVLKKDPDQENNTDMVNQGSKVKHEGSRTNDSGWDNGSHSR